MLGNPGNWELGRQQDPNGRLLGHTVFGFAGPMVEKGVCDSRSRTPLEQKPCFAHTKIWPYERVSCQLWPWTIPLGGSSVWPHGSDCTGFSWPMGNETAQVCITGQDWPGPHRGLLKDSLRKYFCLGNPITQCCKNNSGLGVVSEWRMLLTESGIKYLSFNPRAESILVCTDW
jgi:hypothetical protein